MDLTASDTAKIIAVEICKTDWFKVSCIKPQNNGNFRIDINKRRFEFETKRECYDYVASIFQLASLLTLTNGE